MSDANEMVKVELSKENRLRLDCDLCARIRAIEYANGESLDVRFALPAGWPVNEETEITFSQVVVIARKLTMRIHIRELEMTPL
jgi:hypothetical protein